MTIPDLTRYGLKRRLDQRRRERWTDLGDLESRYRGSFAYVTGTDTDGDPCVPVPAPLPGITRRVGLGIYLSSKDGYQDSVLPHGSPIGTPAQALDCACGLYLNDPTVWFDSPPETPV